ncbi:hypothetical protein [Sinorhizobium americanum]|uniref:hypothetical protein n=1 Tax=Sinorhizobium americanum TaxID=194963 RepID=UPI001F19681F|nr:hypothetical protein [Sinorhizobium americanum]
MECRFQRNIDQRGVSFKIVEARKCFVTAVIPAFWTPLMYAAARLATMSGVGLYEAVRANRAEWLFP